MFTSSDRHQWSPDGIRWFEPRYHEISSSTPSGGSEIDWPKNAIPGDKRRRLSNWGSLSLGSDIQKYAGGCCAEKKSLYNVDDVWNNQPYTLEFTLPARDGIVPTSHKEVAAKPVR